VKKSRWRWLRAVIPFAIVLGLITFTLVAHSVQRPDPAEKSFLSPVSDADDGGSALAARLTQRGIEVDRRTSTPEAMAAVAEVAGSTLFITAPEMVNPVYLRELPLIPTGARIVLVTPTAEAMAAAGAGVPLAGPRWTAAVPEPGCAEPFATAPAAVLRWQFGPTGDEVFRCYADSVVELARGASTVTLVGASDPFRNDRLDEHGNAAFAVGLLSRGERVVWLDLHEREVLAGTPDEDADEPVYEPDPEETSGDVDNPGGDSGQRPDPPPAARSDEEPDNPLGKVFPSAFWATVLVLVLALIALAAASARRLGAPVAEPLPTRVRAAETVRGLGGLYRRARARDASLGTLQAAAVRRLAIHFGLPPDSGVDDVAEHVGMVTGQTVHEVRALLGGGVEDTDEDLAAKAAAVQNLVRYVTGQPGNDEGNVL
jgi:hypothetical protein